MLHICRRLVIFTTRLAKQAEVMFSQASVYPSLGGGCCNTKCLWTTPPPSWTWDLVTTPPSPRTWDLVTTPPPPSRTWTWDLVTTLSSPSPRTWTWDLVTTLSFPLDMDMGPGHNTPLPPGHGHGTWSQHPPLPSPPPGHGHGTWSQHPPPPWTWTWDLVTTPTSPSGHGHGTWLQHPPHRTMRRRAVHIILECILVFT